MGAAVDDEDRALSELVDVDDEAVADAHVEDEAAGADAAAAAVVVDLAARVVGFAGAVAEALTNASKHGRAGRATVYAEPGDDDAAFVSVKDDGSGFDPATIARGQGLHGSITGRITDAGGRVEIDGRPGRGTEVRIWL